MPQDSISRIPTVTTLKRGLGISRIHLVLTVFFVLMVLTVWNPSFLASVTTASNSIANTIANGTAANTVSTLKAGAGSAGDAALITIPLGVMPAVMLATPIILLFVYDKNNGMLEYFLSLGMRQREIYTSYLKAALLLIVILFAILAPIYIALGYLDHVLLLNATIMALMIPMSLADVSFMMIAMFAFSSLQKTRAGGNQPIGMILGVVWLLPGLVLALAFPMGTAIVAELALTVVVALLAMAMLMTSGKLISREKLLPS